MAEFAALLGTVSLSAAVVYALVWLVRSGHLSLNLGFKLGKPKDRDDDPH